MNHLRFGLLALPLTLASLACSNGGSGWSTCPADLDHTSAALTAGMTGVTSFGDNPGALEMFVHEPPGGKANAVVVALHGCTQTADAYAAAGWNELADKVGFAVVYPQQSTTNNGQRCFRWWDEAHVTRDKGEARSIKAMTDAAKAKYGATRAFVTGLSAGAAMSVALLAAYPDVYEAGAIMSGIPYGCAKGNNDSFTCMSGKDLSADQWAALLPAAARSHPPRVSVWHGDADYVVRPTNADQIVRQWTKAHGLSTDAHSDDTVASAAHQVFRDASGHAVVERWMIPKMGHGTAIAPAEGCGKAGAFILDVKLCSTEKAAEFFGLTGAGAGSGSQPGGPGASGGPAGGGGVAGGDGAAHNEDCPN